MSAPPAATVRVAVKYRLYPTRAQATQLAQTLETCRRLYNRFLAERKANYEQTGTAPSYYNQKRALPAWKTESEWLRRANAQALQDVALRVERAFAAFFRRVKAGGEKAGYPRFKGQGWYDSFTLPQEGAFRTHNDGVTLSKIGRVRAVVHRPLPGRAKTLTVRRQNGKWYACVACEVVPAQKLLPVSAERVALDVGLTHFATTDTGERIANPRFFRTDQHALAKAQRRLAKGGKGTPTRRRRRKVVARIHERIRNRRHDFAHQQARRLVNRYGLIAVEDLHVAGMVRNHALAKSISDAAWSQFRTVLTYKAESAGRVVVAVPPAYTSQRCSGCQELVPKTLSERVHACPHCGLLLDRDHNAALNLLALAVGLHGGGTQPTEAPAFRPGE